MDRLMIDFSQVVSGQNETSDVREVRTGPVHDTLPSSRPKRPEAPGLSFEDMLTESIKKVNSLQIEAEQKVRDLAIGDVDDISEVVLASSRADTALRLLMELRNKFLDAYQALSRITG